MDDIINLIGTKYDFVKQYISKYKEDGIVWFLEVYEMSSSRGNKKFMANEKCGIL